MNRTQSETKSEFSIHPKTMMGHISLAVANLDNQIAFYTAGHGIQTPSARWE